MPFRLLFRCLLCFLCLPLAAHAQEALQSPAAFLGYELGTRFTPHHRVVDYVEHVAAASPRVVLAPYGETYEGRPLMVAYLATPERLARLDAIREDNLRRAGLLPGDASQSAEEAPALVWLSYNVHGNESVSTEAALATLYALADPANAEATAWLEDVVVVVDPALNPDGRDRYVSWYTQTVGAQPNPRPEAREHDEPWPGGRTNHYYFDLNRDWAWQTQQESRQRVALYNRWMPHIHVDFHEQGVEEPYYFAPAAEPFHEQITDWQRRFQTTIGQNHARYFDREGWLYFTRERFDLLYPAYGDTWPTYNGAIGMTYEQGGSGRAGLAIITEEGDTLTLADRIAHHVTTGLSTIEVAAANRADVVGEFERYFEEARSNPKGAYRTYVVKSGPALDDLADLLDRSGIRYGYATRPASARGQSYAGGPGATVQVEPGDLVVQAAQPKGVLAQVLFEPATTLSDSLTYDITAWALPYAFGLDAYAFENRLDVQTGSTPPPPPAPPALPNRPYAYLVDWQSTDDARFLARVLQAGVKLRYAMQPFEAGGRRYGRGTLILTRTGNEALGNRFDTVIREAAQALGRPLYAAASGLVASGTDFGSSSVPFLEKPRVMALSGAGTSPYSVGELWHFFDQTLDYPLTLVEAEAFRPDDLDGYDVLIMPSGSYRSALDSSDVAALRGWVERGGRLVAMGGALGFLTDQGGFAVTRKERSAEADSSEALLRRYADRERTAISKDVAGAIYRVRMDPTHPLAFGYEDAYHTLKRGADAYAYLKEGWNVGVIESEASLVSGFAGAEAQERLAETLVFGVERVGRGSVVYLVDDPLFRGFWAAGGLLLVNAVFLR